MNSIPERCPDTGACHHECAENACFRVRYCGPLSIAGYPNHRWPDDIVAAHTGNTPDVDGLSAAIVRQK
jgi:hypothetical protein